VPERAAKRGGVKRRVPVEPATANAAAAPVAITHRHHPITDRSPPLADR
jgi:hypothetical protein